MTMSEAEVALPRAPMVSSRAALRVPRQGLLDDLYEAVMEGRVCWPRWPGGPETAEVFHATLSGGVLATYALESRDTGTQVALAMAFNANLHHGYSYAAVTMLPEVEDDEPVVEGAFLFLNYLFRRFSLRNVYVESLSGLFHWLERREEPVFDVECRFAGQLLVDGAGQDLLVGTVSRDRWDEHGLPLLATSPDVSG